MDVLRGAFWYNIWIGIGFFFSFIVSLGITDFSGSQIYVSCAGTVNPVVSRNRSPFTFVRSAGRGRTSCGSVITHYDTFILRLQSIVGSPRGMRLLREPPWLACAIHTANQVCPASLLLQAILPPTVRENPPDSPEPSISKSADFSMGTVVQHQSQLCAGNAINAENYSFMLRGSR